MAIEPIKPISGMLSDGITGNTKSSVNNNLFSEALNKAILNIEASGTPTDIDTAKILAGQDINLDEFLINLQKAEMTLDLTLQVRDKIIEAYKEIMRMQI